MFLLNNLPVAQLVMKFPAFCKTRSFPAVFKSVYHFILYIDMTTFCTSISCLFNIHFNIIFYSMVASPNGFFARSLRIKFSVFISLF